MEGIPHLGQFALEVIADGEAPRDCNIRDAFTLRPESRKDSDFLQAQALNSRRIRMPVKANGLSRRCTAGIGNIVGVLWMLKGQLPFAHVGEAGLVHYVVAKSPRVAEVVLLKALADIAAETGDICASKLEESQRLEQTLIGEVVIKTEALLVINPVVDTRRDLVLAVTTCGNGLEK